MHVSVHENSVLLKTLIQINRVLCVITRVFAHARSKLFEVDSFTLIYGNKSSSVSIRSLQTHPYGKQKRGNKGWLARRWLQHARDWSFPLSRVLFKFLITRPAFRTIDDNGARLNYELIVPLGCGFFFFLRIFIIVSKAGFTQCVGHISHKLTP